jgi:hypothetical protein
LVDLLIKRGRQRCVSADRLRRGLVWIRHAGFRLRQFIFPSGLHPDLVIPEDAKRQECASSLVASTQD